jgi:hypothetical protein
MAKYENICLMLYLFTLLADVVVYDLLGLDRGLRMAQSLHFFIEDTTKIFCLLFVLIYAIAWMRSSLNTDKVRQWLQGKPRFLGYLTGAAFGAVTPFCSCSSIPLFLGFTQARIPVGITLAFLITSPIINEVAFVLLGSLLGIPFMLAYAGVGILAGFVGGIFFDLIRAERWLTPLVKTVGSIDSEGEEIEVSLAPKGFAEKHAFAREELFSILGRIWKWVFIGVGLGAILHGYVPQDVITERLGSGQWWSVPLSVLVGIPLYINASGMIPVAESLLNKGLPVGTTLAFMLSTVAASLPEFMMLKQVMKPRLLLMLFGFLLVVFTLVGWFFNAVSF